MCRLRIEHLEVRLPLSASGYEQTNLAADQPGAALIHDPELTDAWGIAINPNGTFWLSARATDVSTVYSGDVTQPDGTISPFVKSALTVTIPGGSPTGQVFNGSNDFVVTSGAFRAPARFIFASDTGHITGWSAAVPPPAPSRNAQLMASTPGAVYTGLAIGNNGAGNFLYAADFQRGEIDVFDRTYTSTTLVGGFVDPGIPDGYAPFNIQDLGGQLYVTYARPHHEDPALPLGGGGFISVFDTNGNFLKRLVSKDHLMAPWGVALAPSDFGEFSGAVIVGNFRTGHLNGYDATSGEFLGRLRDAGGDVIQIDGLLGLHFGNGTVSGDRNALYFAAAPEDGAHGLFGSLRVAPAGAGPLDLSALEGSGIFAPPLFVSTDLFSQGALTPAALGGQTATAADGDWLAALTPSADDELATPSHQDEEGRIDRLFSEDAFDVDDELSWLEAASTGVAE
jgi:uncharacterized protein (TIGR03118 family)